MADSADISPTLPGDLAACQTLIQRLTTELAVKTATVEQLSATVERLDHERQVLEREKRQLQEEFDAYVRKLFLSRRERYIHNPLQMLLDLGDSPEAEDVTAGLAEAVDEAELQVKGHVRRRRRKPGGDKFPEHLERREVVVEVPDEVTTCPTHGPRRLIDYDILEKLCMTRPQLWVEVRKYPKYACPADSQCGVASPERPTGLVDGDRYDTSVAAEVITCKFGYHSVQGEAVFKMRVGLSQPGDRTWLQTGPSCDGQEPWW